MRANTAALVVVCTLCLSVVSGSHPQPLARATANENLRVGIVTSGEFYTVAKGANVVVTSSPHSGGKPWRQEALGEMHLYRVRVADFHDPKGGWQKYSHPISAFPASAARLRLRITHGCYWANAANLGTTVYRAPLKELEVLASRSTEQWAKMSAEKRTVLALKINSEFRWTFHTYQDLFSNSGSEASGAPPQAFHDVLPIADNQVLLFLVWQRQIRVWHGELDLKAGFYLSRKNLASKEPLHSIAVEWAEPFMVFGSAPNFIFVTESGRLYCWRGAGQAKQQLEQPWQSARRIRTLITDNDTGKTWAFATIDPGTLDLDPVYFELDPELGVKGKLTKFTLPNVNSQHLPAEVRELIPYVKVLEKDKKLKRSAKP